jgi:hypothetical protein
MLHNANSETVVTRGSRTLNIPAPIRYRSFAGLTRNSFRGEYLFQARQTLPSLEAAVI